MSNGRELAKLAPKLAAQRELRLNSEGAFSFRNKIINGKMEIAQRGTSFTVTAGASPFTADRWSVYSAGSSAAVTQVAGYAGFRNALQLTGAAGNATANVFQRIEAANCYDLASVQSTISLRVNSSTSRAMTLVLLAAGAADNFSSLTSILDQTISLAAGENTVVVPVSLPASAANGLQLDIRFPNLVSGTVAITGVQLEAGEVATPFEHRPIGVELALCQRYFEIVVVGVGGYTAGNDFLRTIANFRVTKRATPTLVRSTTESYNTQTIGHDASIHSLRYLHQLSTTGVAYSTSEFSCSAEL